jgi:WD40 repeat protein
LRVLKGHTGWVTSVAPLGDGKRLVSGSEDHTLRLWDARTGQCLRVLEGHTGWVTSVAPLGDGTRLVSGSTDNTLRLWDAHSGQCLRAIHPHKRGQWLSYEPGSRKILAASPEAWRYLRWHLNNPAEGDDGLRHAEFFGPLPPALVEGGD